MLCIIIIALIMAQSVQTFHICLVRYFPYENIYGTYVCVLFYIHDFTNTEHLLEIQKAFN